MKIPAFDATEIINTSLGEVTSEYVAARKVDAESNEEDFLMEGVTIAPGIVHGDSHYRAVLRTATGTHQGLGLVRDEAIQNALVAAVTFEVSVLREPTQEEVEAFQSANPFGA